MPRYRCVHVYIYIYTYMCHMCIYIHIYKCSTKEIHRHETNADAVEQRTCMCVRKYLQHIYIYIHTCIDLYKYSHPPPPRFATALNISGLRRQGRQANQCRQLEAAGLLLRFQAKQPSARTQPYPSSLLHPFLLVYEGNA